MVNNGFESSQQYGYLKYGSGENILKELLFGYRSTVSLDLINFHGKA